MPGARAAAPTAERIAKHGPVTQRTLVLLWDITGHDLTARDAAFASMTAANADVPGEARQIGVRLVTASADEWKDVTEASEDQRALDD